MSNAFKLPNIAKEFKLDRATQRQVNSFRKELIKMPTGVWGLALLGVVGLVAYLVLANKNLTEPPFPIIDPAADFIGDTVPGIEGLGEEFLEDIPIGSSSNKDAAYVNAYAAEALASEVGDRLSLA